MALPAGAVGPRARFAAIGAALLAAAVAAQVRIDRLRAEESPPSPLLYLPSGRALAPAALGFDDLLADVLYLWSIQYYSNYRIQDRYLYLDHIYREVITELDPHYLDAYQVGALIMSSEARQPEMALRLLDKGIANNPDDWLLAFDAGFLCESELHDYKRAAGYFEKALLSPDVHPAVRRFYAEMVSRAGDKRSSLRAWASIYESSTDPYVRSVSWNHVHDLKVDVDLQDLDAALDAYAGKTGRRAARLEDLVAAGVVDGLPRDPEGEPYAYDARGGRAAYRGSRVLGR